MLVLTHSRQSLLHVLLKSNLDCFKLFAQDSIVPICMIIFYQLVSYPLDEMILAYFLILLLLRFFFNCVSQCYCHFLLFLLKSKY